jgi:hypothetical protein
MPIIKYCGINLDRVLIGGRFFYNHRRHQQTDFGDFVDKEFVENHLEELKKNNFVIYDDDETEKELRKQYDKNLRESCLNRTESQRISDLCRLRNADSKEEIKIICIPYKKDQAFMEIAKEMQKKVAEKEKELVKRSQLIKLIFQCKTAVEIDKIVRENENDWEIKEAGEQRKIELTRKENKIKTDELITKINSCNSIEELDELAMSLPTIPDIIAAIDIRMDELGKKTSESDEDEK